MEGKLRLAELGIKSTASGNGKHQQQQQRVAANSRQSNQQKVATTTAAARTSSSGSKQTTTSNLLHADPLQSIANVLNHHSAQQQQRRRRLSPHEVTNHSRRQRTGGEQVIGSGQATAAAAAADQVTGKRAIGASVGGEGGASKTAAAAAAAPSAHSNRRTSQEGVGVGGEQFAAEKQSAKRLVGQAATAAATASVAQHDDGDDAAAVRVKQTNEAAGARREREAGQVDQGNSYLYAYNDFITTTAPATTRNKTTLAANSPAAATATSCPTNSTSSREVRATTTTTTTRQAAAQSTPSPPLTTSVEALLAGRNFFLSTKQKVFAASATALAKSKGVAPIPKRSETTTNKQKRRESALESHKSPPPAQLAEQREFVATSEPAPEAAKSTQKQKSTTTTSKLLTRLQLARPQQQQQRRRQDANEEATGGGGGEQLRPQLVEGEVLLSGDDDEDELSRFVEPAEGPAGVSSSLAVNGEEEEETEEEEDDTLSFILNRHNLLIGQQQQLQLQPLEAHLLTNANDQLAPIGAKSILISNSNSQQQQQRRGHARRTISSVAIRSNHKPNERAIDLLQEVDDGENQPRNHLSKYLQIEENFNSYKAAKRRHSLLASMGPSSAANSQQAANLHLPLANYIIAGNEQAEANHEFSSYQNQQLARNQDYPMAAPTMSTNNAQTVNLSPGSSMTSLNQQPLNHHHQQHHNHTQNTYLSNLNLLSNQHQHQHHQQHQMSHNNQPQPQQQREPTRSYLQLFKFVKPGKLIGQATSKSGKMYSTHSGGGGGGLGLGSSQPAMGQLHGQAGAYYVHTNSSGQPISGTGGELSGPSSSNSSSEANLTSDNLIAHERECAHNQQQHLMVAGTHHAHLHQPHHAHHHHHHQLHNQQAQHPHAHNHAHHPPHHPQHHPQHHQHHSQQQQQQQHYVGHHHHHAHQQQHYSGGLTTSSDSSLGSSGAFASSAMRATSHWLRDFCSKKCLFVACLMLILFIFILVISLSAYLNFLISSTKPNLQPLSGRLRVDLGSPSDLLLRNTTSAAGGGGGGGSLASSSSSPLQPPPLITSDGMEQFAARLFNNKSSIEFLAKQRDFETIIRGAMDRTQAALKNFPNHLVKLEVYAIKPTAAASSLASLWVYFRLFLNKRTLQQDAALMKRKPVDEQFDKHFLPRLTQQTLQSGFEQLLGGPNNLNNNQNRLIVELAAPPNETVSAAQAVGINSRRFGQQMDSNGANGSNVASRRTRATTRQNQNHQQAASSQQQQLKSFDEQINRLMYLIEAIDLQSILVTPDFDMIQTLGSQANQPAPPPASMSDGLRASQPITTTTTTSTSTTTMATLTKADGAPSLANVMVASGNQRDNLPLKVTAGNNNSKLQVSSGERQPTIRQADQNGDEESPPPPVGPTTTTTTTAQQATKFTLQQGYKENATRPSSGATSGGPATTNNGKPTLFLVNQSQKSQVSLATSSARPPTTTTTASQQVAANKLQQSGTLRDLAAGKEAQRNSQVVRLVSGQPIVSQSGQLLNPAGAAANQPAPANSNSQKKVVAAATGASSTTLAANSRDRDISTTTSTTSTTSTPIGSTSGSIGMQIGAPSQTALGSSSTTASLPASRAGSSSTRPTIEELWNNALNGVGVSGGGGGQSVASLSADNGTLVNSAPQQQQQQQPANGRLITVTTIGGGSGGQELANNNNNNRRPPLSSSDWHKISVLSGDVTDTARTHLNVTTSPQQRPSQPTTTTTTTSTAKPPKVAPPMNFAGSLMTQQQQQSQPQLNNNAQRQRTSGGGGGAANQVLRKPPIVAQPQDSAVILNREFANNNNNANQVSNLTQQQQQQPASSATLATSTSTARPKRKKQKQQLANDQRLSAGAGRNNTSAAAAAALNGGNGPAKPPGKPLGGGGKPKKVSSNADTLRQSNANQNQAAQNQSQLANATATTNSKGIRIVDNFLASIGAGVGNQAANRSLIAKSRQEQQQQPATTSLPNSLTTIELSRSTTALPPPPFIAPDQTATRNENNNSNNNTLEFVLADQQARPGTTSFSGQWRPIAASTSTASSSGGGGEGEGGDGQPLISSSDDFWSSTSGRNRTRSPSNLSLIIATERLPDGLNRATGSQSPFAMPNQMMAMLPSPMVRSNFVNRFRAPNGPVAAAGNQQAPRGLLPPPPPPSQNDFESRRVSRMRQSQAHSHRSSESGDQFGASSSMSASSSTTSSASSSSTTTTSTTSSLNLDLSNANSENAGGAPLAPPTGPSTRIVDDFMITTDRNDGANGRSSTLLPPLVLSGLHNSAAAAATEQPVDAAVIHAPLPLGAIAQAPKRTRGPFAFETLRSLNGPSSSSQTLSPRSGDLIGTGSGSDAAAALDPLDLFEPTAASARSERSSAASEPFVVRNDEQQQQHVDDKLLMRKQLFLADQLTGDPGELSSFDKQQQQQQLESAQQPTSESSRVDASVVAPLSHNHHHQELDLATTNDFGNRRRRLTSFSDGGGGGVNPTQRLDADQPSLIRCAHYGCRARSNPSEFICLNKTQICDDFLDCHDESDELDCVSLLKLDSRTQRMSFSNGAGIIYLNRRGSLAPMCIDYYQPSLMAAGEALEANGQDPQEFQMQTNRIRRQQAQTQTAHELEALQLEEATRRQNELIRQINTIGQYACSLQSFQRLVSVKINHHDQVDGLNLISSSRLFHKLSIGLNAGGPANNSASEPFRANSSSESYKSGQFEVEISTSSECPSQRTVFVKCGGFECGQDAFSLQQQQQQQQSGQSNDHHQHLAKQKRKLATSGVVINDFPWLVKLFWANSLACHGYLIDESWLIAARDCFENRTLSSEMTTTTIPVGLEELRSTGWTAEISQEHYGNEDYKSIESNRRNVKQILLQPHSSSQLAAADLALPRQERPLATSGAPIVLAKLERPVRFSPLNRPICLPTTTTTTTTSNNSTTRSRNGGELDGQQDELAKYRDCVTVTLPMNKRAAVDFNGWLPDLTPPTHELCSPTSPSAVSREQTDLILNKVELLEANDCLAQTGADQLFADSAAINGNQLLCASEIGSRMAQSSNSSPAGEDDATRVLICSQPTTTTTTRTSTNKLRSDAAAAASRPRWTVVGVQTQQKVAAESTPQANRRRLFTRVSSQIDWIVDTMNPKHLDGNDPADGRLEPRQHFDTATSDATTDRLDRRQGARMSSPDQFDGLNPAANRNSNQKQQQQQQATCNQFRCSTGECLSWSRICDGLYDCSSHDDEKDCHK